MEFSKRLDRQFFWAVLVNVIGTLLAVTLARKLAGNNGYLYALIGSLWFIALFTYEVTKYKTYLQKQWREFKQHIWLNLLLSFVTVVIVMLVVVVARKFFNQFLPAHPLKEIMPPITTLSGILANCYTGLVSVMIAVFEEIAFRHDMLYKYKDSRGLFCILFVVTNLLFAMSHYYNFGGSFLATGPYALAGMIFTLLYMWRKNIWLPILAHFLFNAQSLIGAVALLIFKLMA
ncbi:CPBP family intramembrane metalloprotease [Ligilactobacillus equi]|uniref:Abortive infection protein n=1 Tax=Ligilactobacillus equi DPC 6820 TaxID=1392007 RepID=V7HW84_9LACO|nr:type II CAAX endopeptidase family protein [Ligilactobacillus equi]ETA73535.1 abortive infection protein [Ligilactobacillus equi DPC 6820]